MKETKMRPEGILFFTPAAKKPWLWLVAGLIWSAVGLYLISLTGDWFQPIDLMEKILFILAGILLASGIYRFGFLGFALRNIRRIDEIPKNSLCIFAFQRWTNYPLVVFMIALGVILRKFSPIPKPWLAIMYIGIGGSLFTASFQYYRRIFKKESPIQF
ncbi:MAG: hypothetical protein ACXADB_12500 [Candidatus Hermodarchaeia archaeon]|jgi:hypothetical protein